MKRHLIVLLCFWQLQFHYIPSCQSHEITHEDIKEAMISLVHLIRENTEKLERHEIRERHLGDHIKRSLGILSKKIIDVEEIRSYLQKFDMKVTSLEESLAKMKNISGKVDDIYSLIMTSKNNLDIPQTHGETDSSDNHHLIESQTEMIKNLTRKLEDSQSQQHQEAKIIQMNFMQDESLNLLKFINKSVSDLKCSELASIPRCGHCSEEFKRMINKTWSLIMIESRTVQQELAQLSNGQAVMIGIADDVIDTKKKIEYGRQNIILELEDFVIRQNRVLTNAIDNHVQSIMTSLSKSQDRILSNLTSTVQQELSQIWRQINFLYQRINSYANTSNLFNEQSHIFLNATTVTMDNVQFTISMIKKKTIDLEENLNYLLGRLSILMQEFRQIKNGLGTSLEDINHLMSTIIRSNNDSNALRSG